MPNMDAVSSLSKTPTKLMYVQDPFQLPDTPSSLASSYNKDVIYSSKSSKKTNLCRSKNPHEPISIHSLQSNSILDFSKGIKYNPLHDSIESFISQPRSPTPHNNSILGDFQDLKVMIDDKQKNDKIIKKMPEPLENDGDLIQKWLQDRKRWDTIQQTYEQKVTEAQNKLKKNTSYFNKKIDSMTNQELKYKEEIKNLNQQIDSSKSTVNDQYIKLERNYHELSENNRELNTKYQNLQELYQEKENIIQNIQQKVNEKDEMIEKLEIDNKNITENNNNLLKEIEIVNTKYQNDIKTNTKELNEDLIHATKENERLKQLELTSQNMVERLLKRLEQQIHSAENAQQQLNLKEKEHDQEIMRLEEINCKLQKHLTVFNQDTQSKPSSPCSTSSGSSLFTLSTVITTEKQQHKYRGNVASSNRKYNNEIDSLKKENVSLKQTINKFREMLQIDGDGSQEWMHNTKEFAKQTVFIEKLKNDITQRNDKLNEYKHSVNELATVIDDQKETIHKLQNRINEQMNNISMFEKSNSDISLKVIEERSMRQKLEKEIEDLEFDNQKLRKKLIVFSNNMNNSEKEASTDNEAIDDGAHIIHSIPRPASANNLMNKIQKDQLLLESLRDFLDTYEHNGDLKKQYSFNTPKSTMVNKGNFVHHTMDNKKKPKHSISSMTDLDTDVSMRKKRKSNYRKRSVSRNRSKVPRKISKSKSGKVSESTKVKWRKGGNTRSKRRKRGQSKRYALKTCVHNKHWT